MSIEPGRTLLHYRIVDLLGEGGMGQVWRAMDTSLGREVAVKTLPAAFSQDAERRARFEREARLLASLNHPNIAAIHGLHEAEGVCFLAMELVPGEDLAQRLVRGPLPVDEALAIGRQLCDALQAAHEKGVIHRDLKPANVCLTPEGQVKVLDFGLARGMETSSTDPNLSPTVTSVGSVAGVILGTAAYMSPEQARARPVDRRTDLWALGCVLYEMLTGKRTFEGGTVTDILSAVIREEPDWSRLPPRTPRAVRRLLRRCLDKDASKRLRDAADARLDLLDDDDELAEIGPTPGRAPRPRPLMLVLAALGLIAVGAIGATLLQRRSGSQGAVSLPDRLAPDRQITFTGDVTSIDLASDGRTAAYMTRDRRSVVLQDLDGGGSQTLYTAHAGVTLDDFAFSPDGARVYLMSFPYANRVYSIPRLGGELQQELAIQHLASLSGIVVRPLGDKRWLLRGLQNTLYVGDDPESLEARDARLAGDGVFQIPGLRMLEEIYPSANGLWLAFSGSDDADRSLAGVAAVGPADAPGAITDWSGLIPVGWTNGDTRLYLWRAAGVDERLPGPPSAVEAHDLGDLLRVSIDPRTGRPEGPPALVYPRLSARELRVSPDGARLALVAGTDVKNLLEITLDGTPSADDNPRRMRTRGTGRWAATGFLPRGDLLTIHGGQEFFAIGEDGSRRSIVREPRSTAWKAGISPDGKTMALALRDQPALLLHDIETGRSRTVEVPELLSGIDWSGDGTRIAAMTQRSVDRILVIEVSTGTSRTVTLDCGTRCEFAWEGIALGPEWPWAAVTSEVDTWIVNLETGGLRHLASATWWMGDWQGRWVYFFRGGGQTDWPGAVLFRVPAEGGAEERLLDLPQECYQVLVAPDGQSVVCELDESQLDLRVIEGFDSGR